MGLPTQPCGVPVFIVIDLKVWCPTLTDWGLPVRKSRNQLQMVGGAPKLLVSFDGITVLNAEQ